MLSLSSSSNWLILPLLILAGRLRVSQRTVIPRRYLSAILPSPITFPSHQSGPIIPSSIPAGKSHSIYYFLLAIYDLAASRRGRRSPIGRLPRVARNDMISGSVSSAFFWFSLLASVAVLRPLSSVVRLLSSALYPPGAAVRLGSLARRMGRGAFLRRRRGRGRPRPRRRTGRRRRCDC